MTAISVYGGFGSSSKRIELVAQTIGEQLDTDAGGMNFRDALDLGALKQSMDGRDTYFHSASIMLGYRAITELGAKPNSITAIASPIPEQILQLVIRGYLLEHGMRLEQTNQLEDKLNDENELRKHPYANFRQLGSIACFDTFKASRDLDKQGFDISLVCMKREGLFDYTDTAVQAAIAETLKAGVPVISAAGGHNAFTHTPLSVLADIETGEPFLPECTDPAFKMTITALLDAAKQLPSQLIPQRLRQRQMV